MSGRKIIHGEQHPLTIMAHEIKAPLTSIVDLLTVIEKGYVTDVEKSKELVGRARNKALELVKMVNDILDYTLLNNKDYVKTERMDLKEIITESINTLEVFARQSGIRISLPNTPQEPCFVCGNRTFLLRAFNNLIMNGIKYNKTGGEIIISIMPPDEENKVRIEIKDTGIGMDEDDLESVFTIFHRGKKARKNIDGSIGLGLSLVRQIITGHNGTIEIQSTLNIGTTVTLVLPLCIG
jgi:signal transduction histidine kinase